MAIRLEVSSKQKTYAGSVVGDENASHDSHVGRKKAHLVDTWLSRLPTHERRRLLALTGVDPEDLARRRLEGEPLQYLEGTAAFLDFEVVVDPSVLVPRPETEGLFELAASLAPEPTTIVDIGTGSGVLAIALARRFPNARVCGVDVSPEAVALAAANAGSLGAAVTFGIGDLFAAVPAEWKASIDLIVSNPPYVASSEWPGLPIDVRHEPVGALVAGPRGTEVLERLATESGEWLAPGGWLALEIGEGQAAATVALFEGLGSVEIHNDLAGRDRYALVGRPGRRS